MVPQFEMDGLRIEVQSDPGDNGSVRFDWCGRSNAQYPAKALDPYLGEVATCAAKANRPVEMHFERLEYFNSSTVSCLLRFIRVAKDQNVRVRLIYNVHTAWQKLSFDSLRAFADGVQLTVDSSTSDFEDIARVA